MGGRRGGGGDPVVGDQGGAGWGGPGHGGVGGDGEGPHPLVAGQPLREGLGEVEAAGVQLLAAGVRQDLEAHLGLPQQLGVHRLLPPRRLLRQEAGHTLWLVRDAAPQGREDGAGCHKARRLVAEVVVGGRLGNDVFSLVSQGDEGDGGGEGEAGQDVVEVVEGGGGRELPVEAAQDQQLALLRMGGLVMSQNMQPHYATSWVNFTRMFIHVTNDQKG